MHWCNVVVTSRMVSVWFPSSTVWSWLGGVQPPAAPPPLHPWDVWCLRSEPVMVQTHSGCWGWGWGEDGGAVEGGGFAAVSRHIQSSQHQITSKNQQNTVFLNKKNPKFPLVLSVRLAACYWSLLKKKNFQKCSSAHTSPQIPSLADSLSLSLFSALIFSSVLPIAPLLLDLHHVSIIHVCALLRGNIHLQDENSKHHN